MLEFHKLNKIIYTSIVRAARCWKTKAWGPERMHRAGTGKAQSWERESIELEREGIGLEREVMELEREGMRLEREDMELEREGMGLER